MQTEEQGPGSPGRDAREGSAAPVRDALSSVGYWSPRGCWRMQAATLQQAGCAPLDKTAESDQPCTYLAFLQDVPQQRDVLSGEVPK